MDFWSLSQENLKRRRFNNEIVHVGSFKLNLKLKVIFCSYVIIWQSHETGGGYEKQQQFVIHLYLIIIMFLSRTQMALLGVLVFFHGQNLLWILSLLIIKTC
jgi:hypothetical protein